MVALLSFYSMIAVLYKQTLMQNLNQLNSGLKIKYHLLNNKNVKNTLMNVYFINLKHLNINKKAIYDDNNCCRPTYKNGYIIDVALIK